MATTEEIAWAAGLFEGEGTVYLSSRVARGKRYPYARLRVYSTDRDVLERLLSIVGCGRINGPYLHKPRHGEGLRSRKPIYLWDVANHAQVFRVGRALYGWLGERRRAALEPALEFSLRRLCRNLMKRGRLQPDGTVLVPKDVWENLAIALGEE